MRSFTKWRYICLLLSVFGGLFQNLFSQTLSGTVSDETNAPLPDVSVSLPALHRGTITDVQGRFIIEELHPGVYTVEFTFLGYKKETRSVTMTSGDMRINLLMQETALALPGVVVTGTPQPTDALSSSQSIHAVEGRELARRRGQNIIAAIENSPGVSTYATGAGISKPVIRGLTSQRVLVVADGTRQEGQQWGDEHGPEIDAFDVERIEVLRGPSSVLYGSDALGGVVNIIKHDLPSAEEGDPRLEGAFTFNGFSNNHGLAGDLSLSGASGAFGYRGHFSLRDAGDINTAAGKLFNSGLKEANGGGQLGATGGWGGVSIDYTNLQQELQIHENPLEEPNATPFQKVQHHKVHMHGDFPTRDVRLEFDGSWQRNDRREFEAIETTDPTLRLRLDTYTFDGKGHHRPIGPVFGTMGFSLMKQNNASLAEEKLIPGFDFLNLAGFLYEEIQLKKFNISAGIRYDSRELRVKETPELGVEAQVRNYHALTGNLGAVYRVRQPLAITLNLGGGWRAPSAFELFVDGVHEGTVQYLIGDDKLKSEQSRNLDMSLRYATSRVQGEITVFQNNIADYIYASRTSGVDGLSGFPIYLLRQADARLRGGEFSLDAQFSRWLIITGGFDYTHAQNEETQDPLPLIPANRIKAGVRIIAESAGGISDPYFSIEMKAVASQKRVEEFEQTTAGYNLYSAGVGGEIALGSRKLTLDLSIENLLNTAYRDHLSRYKLYALNPGRNIVLKASVPFTLAR